MNNVFGAYLEDYQYIKIIIPIQTKFNLNQIYLKGNSKYYRLYCFKQESFGNELHLHMTYKGVLKLHHDYYVEVDKELKYPLFLGKIIRSPRFDYENYYDGPLGVEYHPEYCIFRLWTPVAKEVILVLIDQQKTEKQYHSSYQGRGLWEITVKGDLDRFGYYYLVRIKSELQFTLDPYAISSSSNSKMNYVINIDNLYQIKYQRPYFSGNYVDAIIYELNLRDFSIDRFKKNIKGRRSFYLELLKNDDNLPYSNGLKYLLELGVTHLQILPINSFGAVDENDQNGLYNWGYNPIEYNVPSGWYSQDPDNPYKRINEVRQMIDGLHQEGLLVNLDVVYNHVYDVNNYAWSTLVPGYAFRIDEQGFLTNSSGCGNDLATEKKMVRRYIIDSILYWLKMYHVDGFRFDLMGLMDVELINIIDEKARLIYPQIMLYGEGWKMTTGLLPHEEANMFNYWQMPKIAFFNDFYRNLIKGNVFKMHKGFAMGAKVDRRDLEMAITGSSTDEFLFLEPSQSINYIECHDNKTFYDQLIKDNLQLPIDDQKKYVRLGIGIVLLSQGIPFIHAGLEFLRTKHDYENSYQLPDFINKIDWERRYEFDDVVQSLKDLIAIRKEYNLFRLNNKDILKSISFTKNKSNSSLTYRLLDQNNELQIIIKNDKEIEIYYFAPGVTLIYDGKRRLKQEIDCFQVEEPGIYILKRK